MTLLTPYIFFNGNCIEAMNFYKSCIGGKLDLMTYGEAQTQAKTDISHVAQKDRIIHAALKRDSFLLMASDTPELPPNVGNNVQLSLKCDSHDEIEKIFKALSDNGTVTEPLHEAFWGAIFGMLTDKYGFNWMLTFENPKNKSQKL